MGVDWLFTWANPLTTITVWALAAVAVAWLRYDATVWAQAWAVARRRQTLSEFVAGGWWCDICSTYWVTAPLIVIAGPLEWLAVNGVYLLATKHWPTLAPPLEEPEPVVPPWEPMRRISPDHPSNQPGTGTEGTEGTEGGGAGGA